MLCRALTRPSFENLVHAAPCGLLAIDASGIIIAANEVAAHLCGYNPAELTGRHLNLLVPPQYRSRHAKLFVRFLASPKRQPMGTGRDFEIAHKNGYLVSVEIGLEPCLIEATLVTLATLIDITKRKSAERYRASYLRACGRLDGFESVGLAAAVLDSDGAILACNRYFKQTKYLVVDGITAVVQRRILQTVKRVFESGKPHGLRIGTAHDHKPTVALVIPVCHEVAQPDLAMTLALMVIHSSRHIEPIGSELLKEVFELTAAEARVAGSLARGMHVTEIASQLNVSRETIRTELSHIYAKTGLSSQIELVTLLAPFVKQ
jgi:PAS domain S-box-containing protein